MWPLLYGETKFFVMMGEFDVKQAAFKTLGGFLAGSGRVSAMAAAGVASPVGADSFLRVSHVT